MRNINFVRSPPGSSTPSSGELRSVMQSVRYKNIYPHQRKEDDEVLLESTRYAKWPLLKRTWELWCVEKRIIISLPRPVWKDLISTCKVRMMEERLLLRKLSPAIIFKLFSPVYYRMIWFPVNECTNAAEILEDKLHPFRLSFRFFFCLERFLFFPFIWREKIQILSRCFGVF